MLRPLLHLHFLLLLLLCCVSPSSFFAIHNPVGGLVACRPHQIQALTQFKNEFDSSGCNQTDFFNGVWCDNTTGTVTKLQLPSGCLSGTLNPNSSLFRFHHLRYLNLSYNDFTSSSLPSGFGSLNQLEVLSNLGMLSFLDLSKNELTGSFPLVHNLTNLSVLRLSYNHFSGTLNPNSSLFELHHLRYLDVSYNNFSSELPFEFGNLNRLEALSLSSSGFFGQVPPTFSNLTWLTELYLDTNEFTGSFPHVQNLTNLFLRLLSDNHLYGIIPSSLFTMPSLSYLDLRENKFTGPIEVANSSLSYRLEH